MRLFNTVDLYCWILNLDIVKSIQAVNIYDQKNCIFLSLKVPGLDQICIWHIKYYDRYSTTLISLFGYTDDHAKMNCFKSGDLCVELKCIEDIEITMEDVKECMDCKLIEDE